MKVIFFYYFTFVQLRNILSRSVRSVHIRCAKLVIKVNKSCVLLSIQHHSLYQELHDCHFSFIVFRDTAAQMGTTAFNLISGLYC